MNQAKIMSLHHHAPSCLFLVM